YLRGDSRFVDFTRDFVNSGKPVFAICHGPQLLISADVIRGRKGQSYRFLYSKSFNSGTDFRLLGYKYSTSGYYTFQEATDVRS
ncbi:fimbria/pilus outer membrane usher protein, partial [Salmonella enterica subsp. enterica serovar Virginia]|nr:fimbria/pilus outer membrane usher protein [Salmonella enterica subsp. enterica serovar Virginia]